MEDHDSVFENRKDSSTPQPGPKKQEQDEKPPLEELDCDLSKNGAQMYSEVLLVVSSGQILPFYACA